MQQAGWSKRGLSFSLDCRFEVLYAYLCIMELFIQGSNPPQSIIMHSLLSYQNLMIFLWGQVMFVGWARAWHFLSGPHILARLFFFLVVPWQINRRNWKEIFSWLRHQLYWDGCSVKLLPLTSLVSCKKNYYCLKRKKERKKLTYISVMPTELRNGTQAFPWTSEKFHFPDYGV